jgi:hypothetical protein
MSALHQVGHDTENLLAEVEGFTGAIASPVNYSPLEVVVQVATHQKPGFEMILDPQLYFPRSDRGRLREWSYFPEEIDTTDLSSEDWWFGVGRDALAAARNLGVRRLCSPAPVPNQYSNGYYRSMTSVTKRLVAEAGDVALFQTTLVALRDLTVRDRAREIASIVSDSATRDLYLIFMSDAAPRQEYLETEELKGAMLLISELNRAALRVTVGFTGSDAILWKAAGASHCATGKFLNLRRFTPGRFEEPNKGGTLFAYWFEEALLASLRESDLVRVRERALLSEASLRNPHGQQILQRLDSEPGKPWVALGWRQYLHWFADIEKRITGGLDVDGLIANAERNWEAIADAKVFMEEPRNDGRWLRPWRRALAEFNGP